MNKLNGVLNFLIRNNSLGSFSMFDLTNEHVMNNVVTTSSKTYIALGRNEAISDIDFTLFQLKLPYVDEKDVQSLMTDLEKEIEKEE